jgi:hypothetical protein
VHDQDFPSIFDFSVNAKFIDGRTTGLHVCTPYTSTNNLYHSPYRSYSGQVSLTCRVHTQWGGHPAGILRLRFEVLCSRSVLRKTPNSNRSVDDGQKRIFGSIGRCTGCERPFKKAIGSSILNVQQSPLLGADPGHSIRITFTPDWITANLLLPLMVTHVQPDVRHASVSQQKRCHTLTV